MTKICNVSFGKESFLQALLPIRHGGLGLCSTASGCSLGQLPFPKHCGAPLIKMHFFLVSTEVKTKIIGEN